MIGHDRYVRFLTCFLGIMISVLTATHAWASQIAEVAKEEIIVYADETTQIPVGKLSAGAQVHIAHNTRRGGTVVPAYVSGKMVYLKTEDIILHAEGTNLTEHRVDEDSDEIDVATRGLRYLTLSYHHMDLGKRWRGLSSLVYDEQKDYFPNYVFLLEYRNPKIRYFAGLGLGYYLHEQYTYGFEGLSTELTVGYIPWQWKSISYEMAGTAIFSGFWSMQSRDVNGEWYKQKTTAWGYMLSAQLKFCPYDKFSVTLGWSYKYIFMQASDVYVYIEDEPETETYAAVPRIGGPSFYLGLSYRF